MERVLAAGAAAGIEGKKPSGYAKSKCDGSAVCSTHANSEANKVHTVA